MQHPVLPTRHLVLKATFLVELRYNSLPKTRAGTPSGQAGAPLQSRSLCFPIELHVQWLNQGQTSLSCESTHLSCQEALEKQTMPIENEAWVWQAPKMEQNIQPGYPGK